MMIEMTRTFHPVGQGAFYTEQFHGKCEGTDFCIVYDCGTKTSKEKVNQIEIIDGALRDNRPIDILFISHFDDDHVSMIGALKRKRRIKRVVLPLLPIEEVATLRGYYKKEGNNVGENLLSDPVGFFDKETMVFYVEPTDDEPIRIPQNYVEASKDFPPNADLVILKPNGERVDLGSEKSVNIPSGSAMVLPCHSWCYIPHNYEYPARHKALLTELAKRNDLDPKRLREPLYVASKLIALNAVYKSLEKVRSGNINENSMMVYSGPLQCVPDLPCDRGGVEIVWHGFGNDCWCGERSACIYSGDADFHKVKIHQVYGHFWGNVGTVQIPHHGSWRSFSDEFLDESRNCFLCPISVGRQNQYRHPTPSVLKAIQMRHSRAIIVDEVPWARFSQHIRMPLPLHPFNGLSLADCPA